MEPKKDEVSKMKQMEQRIAMGKRRPHPISVSKAENEDGINFFSSSFPLPFFFFSLQRKAKKSGQKSY